jgi:hypothetical protein
MVLSGCDSESAWDCFQKSGDIVQENYAVEGFKDIIIWDRVKLYVSEGPVQQVVVETGSNLINEIYVRVEDSILKVSNRNSCNYVREYGITKVYVTSPKIEKIRNSSGLEVEGIGSIAYNDLELISSDPELLGEFQKDGGFRFEDLNVNILRVNTNGLSRLYLKGKAFNAHFGAADGDVRIEAGELEVQNLFISHRSTNNMIVNPILSIRGQIRGLGDVVAKNRPPIVEVEELFTGRLIFE